MARLPTIPNELAVTPQIESRVTGADVAASSGAGLLAKGLYGVGGALADMGADYERGVELATTAREVDQAQTAALQIRQQTGDDAQAFAGAWQSYSNQRLPGVPDKYRASVEAKLIGIGGDQQRDILGQKYARDQKVAADSISSRQQSLVDEMTDLAQAGQTDTPEYKARHDEYVGLVNGMTSNPFFAYSKDHAAQDISETEDKLLGASVSGELGRVYQTDGFAAAQARAQQIYDDDSSGLSKVQKLKAIQSGLKDVRALYEADSTAKRQFSADRQQIVSALGDGSLDPDDALVGNMMSEADQLNDPVSKLALQSAQAKARLNPMASMPLHDRLGFVLNMGQQPPTAQFMATPSPTGLVTSGNIDLRTRPIVKNADGSVSTVRSITITDDNGRATLIPTVVGGKVVSNQEAIEHWKKTGEQLGVFDSEENADAYAKTLHEQQAGYASNDGAGGGTAPAAGAAPPAPAGAPRIQGKVAVDGQDFDYASGGRGHGNIPPGDYPIGQYWAPGTRPSGFGLPSFGLPNAIPDARLGSVQGGQRLGILIHPSSSQSDVNRILSAGCVAIPQSEWPAFSAAVEAAKQKYGKVILSVDAAGGASIHPASDYDGKTVTANTAVAATTLNSSGGPDDRAAAAAMITPPASSMADYARGVIPEVRKSIADGLDTAITGAGASLDHDQPLDAGAMQDMVDAARIVDDEGTYEKVQALFARSAAVASMNGIPVPDQSALIDQLRAPGATGDEALRLSALDQAIATHGRMQDLLTNDPRALGIQLGLFKEGPAIDFANLDQAPLIMAQRAQEMAVLQNAERTGPLPVLRPGESQNLTAAWNTADTNGKLRLLGAMAGAMPSGTLMATLGQFAGKTDAPMLAVAGALAATSPEAAGAVVRGGAALAANPKFGFEDGAADDYFPATVLAPSMTDAWQSHVDAARAAYADMASRAGDATGKFNKDRWHQAVDLVTGGMVEFNGQKIVAPHPGMSQAQFDTVMARLPPWAFGGAVTPDGTPVTLDFVRRMGHLQSYGDGRYVIELGGTGAYALARPRDGDAGTTGTFVLDEAPFDAPVTPGSGPPDDDLAVAVKRLSAGRNNFLPQ